MKKKCSCENIIVFFNLRVKPGPRDDAVRNACVAISSAVITSEFPSRLSVDVVQYNLRLNYSEEHRAAYRRSWRLERAAGLSLRLSRFMFELNSCFLFPLYSVVE